MIATIAIRSGTNASSEPNTNAEHEQRAEAAEQRLDAARPGRCRVAALRVERVVAVRCTGAPADGHAAQRRARGFSAFGLSPNGWSGSGGG